MVVVRAFPSKAQIAPPLSRSTAHVMTYRAAAPNRRVLFLPKVDYAKLASEDILETRNC